jgi:hypothetical protein
MKSRFSFLTFGLTAWAVAAGCGEPARQTPVGEESEAGGLVRINIQNSSNLDFDRVVALFPDQRVDYGAVPKGGQSDYRTVSLAYRYAYVEIFVGEKTYVVRPIDYVGETLLSEGRYTYVLDLRGDEPRIELIRR